MDEWDRVWSEEPTENPTQEARQLAIKLYTAKLLEAKEKDAQENDTYFQDILLKHREYNINLLAKCYQTILNKEKENE